MLSGEEHNAFDVATIWFSVKLKIFYFCWDKLHKVALKALFTPRIKGVNPCPPLNRETGTLGRRLGLVIKQVRVPERGELLLHIPQYNMYILFHSFY